MSKRVLSVQSFVAVGTVGNRAALLPLQLLGFEVDAVNTVEFSNHVGYRKFGGKPMTVDHLRDVFSAFETNGFWRHTHLLTGYVPGAEALQLICDQVDRLRLANPDLIYLCDAVLGDEGKLYVSEDCIPVYKRMLPKATLTTPNYFEAKILTDVDITSIASLKAALAELHKRYSLPHAMISSCTLPDEELAILKHTAGTGPKLVCAGSSFVDGKSQAWAIVLPAYAEQYQGVGDVFSALSLAYFGCDQADAPTPLARTGELAIASLAGVIKQTRDAALEHVHGDASRLLPTGDDESHGVRAERLRALELRLVDGQDAIRHPDVRFRAVMI